MKFFCPITSRKLDMEDTMSVTDKTTKTETACCTVSCKCGDAECTCTCKDGQCECTCRSTEACCSSSEEGNKVSCC